MEQGLHNRGVNHCLVVNLRTSPIKFVNRLKKQSKELHSFFPLGSADLNIQKIENKKYIICPIKFLPNHHLEVLPTLTNEYKFHTSTDGINYNVCNQSKFN